MKILVTGAHGMIGRNLLNVLNNQDFELLTPTITQLDLRIPKDIDKYLCYHKPDMIVHLASIVGSLHDKELNPYKYLSENISIDNNIINAAYKNDIRKLINISSLLVYSNQKNKLLKESSIMKSGSIYLTENPYAVSKLLTLKLCSSLYKQNNHFRFISLIPCSVFGCYDNYDVEKSHFIASSITKIHNNLTGVVKIWGDGKTYREVIFAEDFAKIISNVIQKYDQLPSLINVGSGTFMRINEYYQQIGRILGFRGKFEFDFTKPSGVTINKMDNTVLLRHFPVEYTKFSDAIEITYQDFIQNR